MSAKIKKVMLVVLVASAVMLAMGGGTTHALPKAEKPDPPDEAALFPQGLDAASAASSDKIGYNFAITVVSNDQVQAAVAYNSQREEYLVVWQNEWGTGYKNIAGQRVSKTGALVGNPFNIYGGTNGHSPDVAYNSRYDSYLVVWQQNDPHTDPWGPGVYACIVSATGQVFSAVDIATASGILDHSAPAVAYSYTSDKYLVVWQSHWSPTPLQHSIEGQFISSAGSLSGSSFTISQDPGNGDYRMNPDVAYNRRRNEHLVVWEQRDHNTKKYNIHAQRVQGATGQLLGSALTITEPYNQAYDESVPAVAAIPPIGTGGQYLVVWQREWSSTDNDILARRVTGEGSTDGSYFVINNAYDHDTVAPAVAGSESSQKYLLAWTHDYKLDLGGGLFIFFVGIAGRAVSSGGQLLGGETYVGGWGADDAAVGSGPLGDFLVAFDDEPPGATLGRDIYGQLWGNRVYMPLVLR
jgi:hypothetical protein